MLGTGRSGRAEQARHLGEPSRPVHPGPLQGQGPGVGRRRRFSRQFPARRQAAGELRLRLTPLPQRVAGPAGVKSRSLRYVKWAMNSDRSASAVVDGCVPTSRRPRRRPVRPPAVIRPHAPLTGEFAAAAATCHQAFQCAVDFGFIAVDAVADTLLPEVSIALVRRLEFCDCGRLVLDGDDLTRIGLTPLAAADMTSTQGLMLAAIDYAHRTFGCAGLSVLIHEFTEGRRAPVEPPALTALLDRVRTAHQAEDGHAGHSRVPDAVTWPKTAASSMPELIPR
jgi:hypothetical protein